MSEEKKLDKGDLLELQVLQLKKQLLEKDKELLSLKQSLIDYDSRILLTSISRKYDVDSDKHFISIDASKGVVVIKEKAPT